MRIWLPIVLLVALPRPAAALRVTGEGPRAGSAVALLRTALSRVGVKRATVKVRVRRRPGAWQVTVTVFKTGSARPALVRVLRARRGQVKAAAAMALARAAARALRVGVRRPRRVTRRRRPRRRVRVVRRAPKPVREEPAPAAPAPAPAPTPAPTPRPAPVVASTPTPKPPRSAAADLGFEVSNDHPGRPALRPDRRESPRNEADRPPHRDADTPSHREDPPREAPRRVARAAGSDEPARRTLRARSDDDDDDDDAPGRPRRAYVASVVDPLLEFDVGLALAWKSHSMTGPDAASNYRSGAHSQFQMTMGSCPFGSPRCGPCSGWACGWVLDTRPG